MQELPKIRMSKSSNAGIKSSLDGDLAPQSVDEKIEVPRSTQILTALPGRGVTASLKQAKLLLWQSFPQHSPLVRHFAHTRGTVPRTGLF